VALGLGSDNRLLQPRQQSLRFIQPQTQIGDVDKIIGSIDSHDIKAAPFPLGVDLHQPHNPSHARPQSKVWLPKYLRQADILKFGRGFRSGQRPRHRIPLLLRYDPRTWDGPRDAEPTG
jgi:hypothetical protein